MDKSPPPLRELKVTSGFSIPSGSRKFWFSHITTYIHTKTCVYPIKYQRDQIRFKFRETLWQPTRCGRSLMLKVTLPVGGAAEESKLMSYKEKRGSWRVISNTWNCVLVTTTSCRGDKIVVLFTWWENIDIIIFITVHSHIWIQSSCQYLFIGLGVCCGKQIIYIHCYDWRVVFWHILHH